MGPSSGPTSEASVNPIKHFTLVNYDSRVNCLYYNSRVVFYDRKMFIRLARDYKVVRSIEFT